MTMLLLRLYLILLGGANSYLTLWYKWLLKANHTLAQHYMAAAIILEKESERHAS